MALPYREFFEKCLREIRANMPAVAAALWLRNRQGYLQLQAQIGINEVGLNRHHDGLAIHNELLRVAFHSAEPIVLEPYDRFRFPDAISAKNLTDYTVMIAPLLLSKSASVGLLEAWQAPVSNREFKHESLQFLVTHGDAVAKQLRIVNDDQRE